MSQLPRDDKRDEVLLCCASGEGSHQFKVAVDEAGVMAFLEEMCGGEEDGTMTHSLAHYRDEDNWSNGGTAYNVKLYCAEFSVWKVLPGELAFTPSHERAKWPGYDPAVPSPLESAPSTTPQKRDYRNCASGTCQNTDGCIVTGCRSALYLAQSALRRWTDLYAKLQNESGEVVSRKLDYNLPPADHVKALEALDEALACTASAIAPNAEMVELARSKLGRSTRCPVFEMHYLAAEVLRLSGAEQNNRADGGKA